MEHKLTQGNASNYEIVLTFTENELNGFKDTVMKSFQKDINMPGFRKGHVPLHLVEQQVRPEYVKMGIYEEAIHRGLNEVISKNQDIKFIGNIYDLNQEEKSGKITFTFKIDIYPEVIESNQNWKTLSIQKIDEEVSEEEVKMTLENIQRQYAQYDEIEKVEEDSLIKAKFSINDKKGESLHTGTIYLGKEEYEEFPNLQEPFLGKTKEDKVKISYKEKELPHILHLHNEEAKPDNVTFDIVDIRKIVLPELTTENIKKFFGDEIKDVEDLNNRVKDTIRDQKKQMGLMNNIDAYIEKAKESLKVFIPQTIISEEFKSRLENFKKRLGGEEGFNKYIQSMGEEKGKQLAEEIHDNAKASLEKFFLFRKLTELLGLENDIKWDVNLDAEQKLYDKLVAEGKVEEGQKTEKKAKAPAKKSKKAE